MVLKLLPPRQKEYLKNTRIEQINFEKIALRGKDLLANPCREMLAGCFYPAVKQVSQA
ncbi:MAG: hypothetical protein LBS77_06370 [Desulfovibrio sp.]|nr:hypothetical protein [Desulfovibrio sp.]